MNKEKKQVSFVRWIISIFAIMFWETKKFVFGGILGFIIPMIIIKLFTKESLYDVAPIFIVTGMLGVMIAILHDNYLDDNKTL